MKLIELLQIMRCDTQIRVYQFDEHGKECDLYLGSAITCLSTFHPSQYKVVYIYEILGIINLLVNNIRR